jgi:hypothetical protein
MEGAPNLRRHGRQWNTKGQIDCGGWITCWELRWNTEVNAKVRRCSYAGNSNHGARKRQSISKIHKKQTANQKWPNTSYKTYSQTCIGALCFFA